MKPNIVATLKDVEYAKKYRERRYCLHSEWQWGLSEDGNLYCRDDATNSIFTGEWFLASDLQLNIDLEVVARLSRWTNSIALKSKISASQDKDAMGTTA
jgi:hypothetical protein